MTFDSSGQLYVSSRFEGTVYRVFPNGTHEPYASDLGIACGLAFDRQGVLYVGDRSGTVFAVRPTDVATIATLPQALPLFMSPSARTIVSMCGPDARPYDHVYRRIPARASSIGSFQVRTASGYGLRFAGRTLCR